MCLSRIVSRPGGAGWGALQPTSDVFKNFPVAGLPTQCLAGWRARRGLCRLAGLAAAAQSLDLITAAVRVIRASDWKELNDEEAGQAGPGWGSIGGQK